MNVLDNTQYLGLSTMQFLASTGGLGRYLTEIRGTTVPCPQHFAKYLHILGQIQT